MIKIKSLNSFSIIAIFLSLFAANIFNTSLVEAQEEDAEEVNGGGDSHGRFTCANGERPIISDLIYNEIFNFNAVETAEKTTGEFSIISVLSGATINGEINSIDVSGGQFTLSGIETSSVLCRDAIPTDVIISGECKIDDNNLPVTEIRFEAANGQQGTFSGGVECIDNDIPINEQFNEPGQCLKFAKDNPTSDITKELCKLAFQNKYNR